MITTELSDKDIEFVDDKSNDVIIPRSAIPFEDIDIDELVEIHYDEDEEDVCHRYTVIDINDDKITLKWKQQLNEDVLNEANPLKAIKDKIMPDQATKLAKAQAKTDNKQAKKATNLLVRDVKHGIENNYQFYLQLPDGNYINKPLSFKDVKHMYSGNNVSPAITNAIVTTSNGYMVRQGKKDLDETGTKFNKTHLNIPSSYTVDWTKDDIKQFKSMIKKSRGTPLANVVEASVNKETPKHKETNAAQEEQGTPKESPASEEAQNTNVKSTRYSDKILDKVKGILIGTSDKVVDGDNKPVNLNSVELTDDVLNNYSISVGGGNFKLDKWLDFMIKNKYITESCDVAKFLAEGLINESPVITLDKDDLVDPKEISFKKKVSQAMEREEQAKELAKKEAAIEVLKTRYVDAPVKLKDSLNSGHTSEETLEVLFDILVPSEGPADSVAGELVRAMMRILYRDANDGDKFFEGYGIETCGSSAEYLFDNGFAEDIQNIIDHAWQLSDDDEKYTDALDNLTHKIVHHIDDNNDLFYTVNEEDSRDYSTDYIVENQPTYEFELYGSDDIDTLVEKGVLTSWDLTKYVEEQLEWESDYRGAEVATPWSHHDTSVTVTNLTRDGYDRLKDSFEHNPEEWWEDLTSEYADDLVDDGYDDDYDDSGEEEPDEE